MPLIFWVGVLCFVAGAVIGGLIVAGFFRRFFMSEDDRNETPDFEHHDTVDSDDDAKF